MNKFEESFDTFLKGCDKIIDENHKRQTPNLRPGWLEVYRGNRYIKIVQADDWNRDACIASGRNPEEGVSRKSHVYVDSTNGDVLKGNWKGATKPKVARGNIFDKWNGLKWMGPYGVAYLDQIKGK